MAASLIQVSPLSSAHSLLMAEEKFLGTLVGYWSHKYFQYFYNVRLFLSYLYQVSPHDISSLSILVIEEALLILTDELHVQLNTNAPSLRDSPFLPKICFRSFLYSNWSSVCLRVFLFLAAFLLLLRSVCDIWEFISLSAFLSLFLSVSLCLFLSHKLSRVENNKLYESKKHESKNLFNHWAGSTWTGCLWNG